MTSYVWNVTTGEWTTTTNWTPNGTPTTADTATLSNGGTLNVGSSDGSVTDFTASAQTLSVTSGNVVVYGSGQLSLYGLSVSGTGTVTINGGGIFDGNGGQGGTVFNQTGNITVTNNGSLSIGQYLTGTVSGTVTLTNGGTYFYQDTAATSTSSNIVDFAGNQGGTFSNSVTNWGGTIKDFNTSTANSLSFGAQITSFSYSTATKTLTVHTATQTFTEKFTDNAQALTTANFSDTGNPFAINYSGTVYQQISSSTYNQAAGTLVVTGNNFTTTTAGYNVTALSIFGEDSVSYNLTSGSTVAANPTATSFTVNLSTTDQLAVDGLLNKNGTTSALGTTYGLSATANFDTGGMASSNAPITTSNAATPTISSVAYNHATGTFTITGTHLENEGTTYGLSPFDFSIKGQGGTSYTLTLQNAFVSSFTSASFAITGTDLTNVNSLLNKNGTAATDNTTYNLASIAGWDSEVGGAITTQAISVTNVCYVSGTRIRTARGDIAVEALRIGDLAVTAAGEHRPIRWLGHRTVDCRRHPDATVAWPIRIAAHAVAPGKPARDLYVSPGHAICLDVAGDVLIPAAALVNGTTVTQVHVDTVVYWHVELDSHDILLAENLEAESYLDMGNLSFFENSDAVARVARPDAPLDTSLPVHVGFCRPFHMDGPIVETARLRLFERTLAIGWTLESDDPFAGLHLVVDGVRVDAIRRGLAARFSVPAGARNLCLVSTTSRPCDVSASGDGRDLGVSIGRMTRGDGFTAPTDVDLAALHDGFHAMEDGVRRWTAGSATIPAALWADHPGSFYLRVELAGPALPRWVSPALNEDAFSAVAA